MKGLESTVLCRDDEDYDAMVKVIAVCALRKNVIVVIYTVVSNHCHVVILAASNSDAVAFGEEIKRIYSMWFSRKYGETGVLRRVLMSAIYLDSDWYVRNALAYVPRNALDNGCNVDDYKWSGYRAMFRGKREIYGRSVSGMKRREKDKILHTCISLKSVKWKVDEAGCLIPGSFCDHEYLENAFGGSQTYFLKTIGSLNPSELGTKLVDMPRQKVSDVEMLKYVEEVSGRWFGCGLNGLSEERKLRLLPYIFRTRRTSINQLSRVLSLNRNVVETAVRRLDG
jgi:REP element-mobilizing transposase RayT